MKHKILISTVIFLLIGMITQNIFAQQQKPSAEMVAANKLIREKKWKDAENAFAKLVESNPKSARAWFFLGFAKHSQNKWAGAIEAFKKTVEIAKAPAAMYNVAAGYSQLNKKDEAFEWLEKAVKAGAGGNIKADKDFDNIKSDARFAKMVQLADKQRNPCKYSEKARQFDFWIGDWDVFVRGRKVGENLVELEVQSCTLVENWKNTGGGTGKSLNVYNAAKKKWQQFYVGGQGGVLEFQGELKDKIMHFTSETVGPNGQKIMHILEFHNLPDKTVRQRWQQSTDGGKTWNTVWDSIYKRKAKKK